MYEEFVTTSQEPKEFPLLSHQQSVNLGWAHTPSKAPTSSYIHFTKEKSKGTIRIGIFGDSFVQGIEAEHGFDFPSFLQKQFKDNGYTNVEVLNFGVHSYGVHQAFLLWKFIGKSYDLDYTIFMPLEFHRQRDRSFIFLYNNFAPIHARYILVNDSLELLPVIGETREEAGAIYNSILPPWNYIRYDDKPPAFLRTLLPMSRTLSVNPFYYRRSDPDEEILTTYARLFEELAHTKTQSLVICNRKMLCDVEKRVKTKAPVFLKSRVRRYVASARFLYTAPRTHMSALGNQLRASELYAFLVQDRQDLLKVLTIDTHMPTDTHATQRTPLHNIKSGSLEMHGHRVASFMKHRIGEPPWTYDEDLNFAEENITSLLWITGDRNFRIIPTAYALSDQEPVFLLLEFNDVRTKVPIGIVHSPNSYIGSIELFGWETGDCVSMDQSNGQICFDRPNWTRMQIEAKGSVSNVELAIGNAEKIILRGHQQSMKEQLSQFMNGWSSKSTKTRVRLTPAISEFSMIRAKKGDFVRVENFKEKEGTLDFVAMLENGETLHHPMFRYTIHQIKPVHSKNLIKIEPPNALPTSSDPGLIE